MKKSSFLLWALSLLLAAGCGKKDTFTLKGDIKGLASDTIRVVYEVPGYKLDTIIAQQGKFRYDFVPDTFTVFSLLLDGKDMLPVYAEKGGSVTVDGDAGNIRIKGKGENERMNHILQAVKRTGTDKREQMATIDSFITRKPDSFTNIYLINKYYAQDSAPDYKRMKELTDGLSGIIKDTPYISGLISKLEEAERQSRMQVASFAPLPDKNGRRVGRNDMKDRYVLLDFWASWDKASKAAQDSLVSVQQALKKEKFLIVSISLDMDREEWLKACDKDTVQWKQVCDFKGWENELVKQQGISTLPANLLIGPDKRIIARNIRGNELIEKVKQLAEPDKKKARKQ